MDYSHGGIVDSPILDRDHLARYTLGDAELEREVLELFLMQLPQSLEALRRCSCRRDWEQATHTLKGSARAVGAWRLADAAERAEGGVGRPADWASLRADVDAAASEVRRHLAPPVGLTVDA